MAKRNAESGVLVPKAKSSIARNAKFPRDRGNGYLLDSAPVPLPKQPLQAQRSAKGSSLFLSGQSAFGRKVPSGPRPSCSRGSFEDLASGVYTESHGGAESGSPETAKAPGGPPHPQ